MSILGGDKGKKMPHRYTIKELNTLTDYEILEWVIRDRMETTTNIYAPLYQKLSKIANKLEKKEPLSNKRFDI